jgi:hypothetical protein
MNAQKQAAIEQAAKLRTELDKLQAIINAPDEPEVPTYRDIMRKSFQSWWISRTTGKANESSAVYEYDFIDKATAEREAIRTMWLNIAAYVNDGGTGNWCVGLHEGKVRFVTFDGIYPGVVLFKSKTAAELALKILGEDNFRKM